MLIQQVVQAQLQNAQAQDLVLKQGKVLKQVSQQPKGGLTLEQKRMQAEPGDKPKLISVGVEVNGKHALNGDLSGLQVVALVAPGVSSGKQRIYAQQGGSYYTMQTGGGGKKKRLIFAEITVAGEQHWCLRVPAPNNGPHYAWFLWSARRITPPPIRQRR